MTSAFTAGTPLALRREMANFDAASGAMWNFWSGDEDIVSILSFGSSESS